MTDAMRDMSEQNLQNLYWWLNSAAIWIPIFGAVIGAMCALGAWRVNDKLETVKRSARSEIDKALRSAIPERRITPLQRDTLLEVLIDPSNISPKIPVKVIVEDADQETKNFAREMREVLSEAGYGKDEKVLTVPNLKIRPSIEGATPRTPAVIALFSSPDNTLPPHDETQPPCILMFNPTTVSIARGDKSHPRLYRYAEDPNEILYALAGVLRFVGIKTDQMSAGKILKPGEVGFLIPKQVD